MCQSAALLEDLWNAVLAENKEGEIVWMLSFMRRFRMNC